MIDQKNVLIISYLRKNAREKLTKISKETRIPVSTIHERLKSNKFIEKSTCLLNFSKLGFTTRVEILLKVNSSNKDKMEEVLANHENVNTLHSIVGDFDFLVEAVFEDVSQLQKFIEHLETSCMVLKKEMYFIVKEIRKENFLSRPNLVRIGGINYS